ncbi:hypothetical protein CC86DRAFT_321591 [Ophiobolus disseminans]|uniref:Peptidase S54 rhomboid domain-containing protein n=1 Tax=Ophiobolus disseminans TaxID=1469910 RepID=A0A6A7A2Z6_9PLEO|nr:hypothetical protein CC86DRAFT_321591 [Ophiobolus disseminans]
MSVLRLLRTTRTTNPLLTRSPQVPRMSNYFHPSHSPFPRPPHLGLARSRFYSSSSSSQVSANLNVLWALMGINIAVYGYAQYAKEQARAGYPAAFVKFLRTMSCNLTDVLKNNAYYTLVTSTFTHLDTWHLAANMFTTYYLGQFLCYSRYITPGRLITIALGAGVMGSAGYLYQRYLVTGGKGVDYVRGLGFSGALMGITSVAACMSPMSKVAIYGIIPVPLWAVTVGYAVLDGYYLNDQNSRIGHAGHLGGLAFGIMYYLLNLRGLRV